MEARNRSTRTDRWHRQSASSTAPSGRAPFARTKLSRPASLLLPCPVRSVLRPRPGKAALIQAHLPLWSGVVPFASFLRSCRASILSAPDPAENDAASAKWPLHAALVVLLALGVGLLFLQEPGFGDDFTYWTLAFGLHDRGAAAWNLHSFHDLRWPVWGVSWLWQCLFGPGLSSYYCVPLLYLVAAALLAFAFGRAVLRSLPGAWCCAIAVLFMPVLNPVVYRPMPDLGESVLGAAALLTWWKMMRSAEPRRAWPWGVVCGLCIGLAFSNRITGLFITPLLALATFFFFPSLWRRLLLPAGVAALYFGAECAVYQYVCGDWLHTLHANLGSRGAKDAGPMALWRLPVRFLPTFTHADRLAPLYAAAAAAGLWLGWRRWGALGQLAVLWFGVLYLEYSCAIQSIHPLRPLIGNTSRYMGVLALPMAVLVGLAALEAKRFLQELPWLRVRHWRGEGQARGFLVGAVCVVLLALASSRPFFNLGFLPALRQHLEALPRGSKVFTHRSMRELAFLTAPASAAHLAWSAPRAILEGSRALEEMARAADHFCYIRKLLWLTARKDEEHAASAAQPELGTYLASPERDWILSEVLAKGGEPEVIFYRRRPAGAPAPHILEAAQMPGLFPMLPASWTAGADKRSIHLEWEVPPALRGKLVNFQFDAASPQVEPMNVKLELRGDHHQRTPYLFKPIVFAAGGREFLCLSIPESTVKCALWLNFASGAKGLTLTNARAIYDDTR